MSIVYLVRHGQTLWNSDMRFQGTSDIELSDLGIKQAQMLADRFAKVKLNAVYSSNLNRAVNTAKIVAQKHDLQVIEKEELKEICFGAWEGLNKTQIDEKWPGQLEEFFQNPVSFCIPAGESFAQIQQRAYTCFEEILKQHKESRILIVAHGAVIRAVLAEILKMDLSAVWNLRQENTAVNIINNYGERKIVSLINDTRHLL